jgi:hypothetical protein
MTDYHPLIARAVDGLARNTGEARRALYERARAALVAQLRAVEPALPESDITKERLALEEAIRKVESEAARKALVEPRPNARPEPRADSRAPSPVSRAANSERKARTTANSGVGLPRERLAPALNEAPPAESAEAPQAEALHSPPNGGEPADAARPAAKLSARNRILEARTSSLTQEGLKGFRNVVNEADGRGAAPKAVQTARAAQDSYAPPLRHDSPQAQDHSAPHLPDPIDPPYGDEEAPATEYDELHLQGLEPSYDLDDQEPIAPQPARTHAAHTAESDEHYDERYPPRSYRGLAKAALVLLIVLGLAATAWEYRGNIAGLYHSFRQAKSSPASQPAKTSPPVVKDTGRVPQEQVPGTAPPPGTNSGTQQAPQVAQRAVLYEADPKDPQGKRFAGSVIWRTETVSPGPGLAPELVVRADIAIPERHMTVTWSLRRNTDKALPASHTIEIMFNLPPDFPGGGIANVPGILMKDSEEVRGMPLAGLAVKVTNGFFLVGLNAADADMQRNLQLLKQRAWFDVLVVYNDGSRAILTMEKGPPGDRAFAEAFSAWGQ